MADDDDATPADDDDASADDDDASADDDDVADDDDAGRRRPATTTRRTSRSWRSPAPVSPARGISESSTGISSWGPGGGRRPSTAPTGLGTTSGATSRSCWRSLLDQRRDLVRGWLVTAAPPTSSAGLR